MANVRAEWSGSFPCLCSGKWTLYVDDVDVSDKIPEELRTWEMGTYGDYYTWHFGDDYGEVWETYEDGLEQDEWINENKKWLDTISTDYVTQVQIYKAINEEDWRHNSCGGCI